MTWVALPVSTGTGKSGDGPGAGGVDPVASDLAGVPAEGAPESECEATAEEVPLGLAFGFGFSDSSGFLDFSGLFEAEGETDADAGADAPSESPARTWSAPDDPGSSWCPQAAVATNRSRAPAVRIPVRKRETGSTKRPFDWAGAGEATRFYRSSPHARDPQDIPGRRYRPMWQPRGHRPPQTGGRPTRPSPAAQWSRRSRPR